jgi:hypothetical protein
VHQRRSGRPSPGRAQSSQPGQRRAGNEEVRRRDSRPYEVRSCKTSSRSSNELSNNTLHGFLVKRSTPRQFPVRDCLRKKSKPFGQPDALPDNTVVGELLPIPR